MSVLVAATIEECRSAIARLRPGRRVALVPTMGALHEGHLSLVDLALERADLVVVSVFVNPTQFGPREDFDRYPRDIERDVRLLTTRGASIVFAPDTRSMYPEPLLPNRPRR